MEVSLVHDVVPARSQRGPAFLRDMLTCVGHVPHGVFEGPDDGVQHQLELGRGNGEEGRETLGVDRLEEVEEVGPVLGVLLKVLPMSTGKEVDGV